MEEPTRRRPAQDRAAYGAGGRRPTRVRASRRSRLPLAAGIGLPVVLVVGAFAVLSGIGGQVQDTVAQAANPFGTPAAGQTAAGGTAGAGTAPVTQRQFGAMLDPRGKHRAARAARQAAAQAKAQAAANAAQAAVPNPNCTLVIPAAPTTAAGLATPFQLVATDPAAGPCNESNVNQSAFVQGAIISPAGQLTLYDPLIVDQGTQPIAPPVAAQVPPGSTVGLWFGFNGDQLTLQSAAGTGSLQQGNCINGLPGSIFGQFGACNAAAFFGAANTAIQNNQLQVPAVGTAGDGTPCPTVRDFSVVDQDQSDNVTTHELAGANGQTGQNNAAARAALQQLGQNPVDLANGSDNRLLDAFVLPTLGCQPWTRPNGSSDGQATPSLPLNELQAAANQAAPVALVPLTDPMTMANNAQSTQKTNLYRAAVGQAPVGAGDNGDGAAYCQNLFTNAAGLQRVFKDMAMLANGPSPDPAAATNLFTFLAMRGQQTFENLTCGQLLNQTNPITLTVTNNIVTAATFTPGGAPVAASASASTSAAPSGATVSPTATLPVDPANPSAVGGVATTPTATPDPALGGVTTPVVTPVPPVVGAGGGAPTPTPVTTRRHRHHAPNSFPFPFGG